ncbi:hypothetical protein RFI_01726 [Reticulomyxa filosa]|uniref:Serpin domain-containing protein n=1 Tax=Reticulomyxa filosa TaxID=46433 RepID=X6PCE6_RETFI|nr:hypothetical protein RFI_01726 [Reticulomyxa filosa]|eukprot:ETO35337.1 hypothetical protein RFI_01726 [Reticulomyxa filosa]
MGSWEIDSYFQAKQLRQWLKQLNGQKHDEHKNEQEELEQEAETEQDPQDDKQPDDDVQLKEEPNTTSLFISTCLFINYEYQLTTKFRKLFKKSVRHARFYDESTHVEIALAIDNWIAKHTLSKSSTIGPHLQLIEASAIGIGALYFRGTFLYSFDASKTQQCQELKKVAFINGTTKCRYYDGKKHGTNWTFVCLDYHLPNHEMLERLSLILVKRNNCSNDRSGHIGSKPLREGLNICINPRFALLEKTKSLNDFYAALKKSKRQVMELSFPKMNLESFVHLSNILEEPLDSAFDVTDANFGRMCRRAKELGLCVSQLIHNVRFVVDESGENALPVDVLNENTGDKESFNYPFDIYLMDAAEDLIFLCGRIADPDPSVPFADTLTNEEPENVSKDDHVKDVNASKWKLCCPF